ncbi:MAG: 23S rRNA (adenine(2503)-C(2))-methyltransferase RlmN [Anaerolineae bacterium]|nr:23S rRNA (adenine(2503)-C(2))-methyltransferase RlmN [Anaerolineae bacterium]
MYSIDLPSLVARLKAWGQPADEARHQALRIWKGLYEDLAADIHQLTGLPPDVQANLERAFRITSPQRMAGSTSQDGSTRKDLLAFADGAQIEAVLLRYRERYTVCVSTQVGCACGCSFCATGRMGFVRDLTADEIVAQVLHYQRQLAPQAKQVSNVVFMGMGEPFLNEAQTFLAVERLLDPRGLNFAPGRITLSTVGIAPGIERLADSHQRWPIKLAVSLHAATDALRTTLMPINKAYPLARLHDALVTYTGKTGRHILLEWVMIAGVNDTVAQATALVDWLDGLPAHINLIQLNPTIAYAGAPATTEAIEAFAAVLDRHGIPHTMRQRRGAGIDAGCGQLYTRQADSPASPPAVAHANAHGEER